jgi:8-oxo-dGTP pyrophosphatase MutT (NUDIX family)
MPRTDDPRLLAPQCRDLTPVIAVHENPWFIVRRRGDFYTTEYNATGVVILPVIDKHSILMVRVKRPVIADDPLELPAGGIKKNEAPPAAAAREFAEETGIEIEDTSRFIAQAPFSNSPNRVPTLIHIFRISLTQAEYDSRGSHDDEVVNVECYRFKDLKKMLVQGTIYIGVPAAVIGRHLLEECII